MNLISILYIKTNNRTDEKISIGLFAIGANKRYFTYSTEKIKVANGIIESNIAPSINQTLKAIKKEVDTFNSSPLKFKDFGLNEASFNYLNTYSKGILSFEKLKPIALEITDASFSELFNLFVDFSPKKENRVSFTRKFNNKLKHNAFKKVDKRFNIDPSILGTYAPHKVDFIGKNGSLLVGSSIDFNNAPDKVDRGIIEFKTITNALMKFSSSHNLPKGNYNIYCNEPDSEEGKTLFDKVHFDRDKPFNLFTLDKVDDVITQIEEGNYIKFSDFLETVN